MDLFQLSLKQFQRVNMIFWKQYAIGAAFILSAIYAYYSGYESGKLHVQSLWNQQQVLDNQAAAIADNKAKTITINSEKVTKDDNLKLKQTLSSTNNYYSNHRVPGVSYSLFKPDDKANSSEVPNVSNTTKQLDNEASNTVSSTDFEKLANDCLATTIQLNNAQDWAAEQVKINAE